VDVTPGQTSTANDTVTGDTTLTLIDPTHPAAVERRARKTRWAKDVLVLPGSAGVALTRASSPERAHRLSDPRSRRGTSRFASRIRSETLRIVASPEGGHVAAEVAFRDSESCRSAA
jgi:hypothetical protein